MVVAAEIHTATHFCAWKIANPTATHPLASAFAATLYQVLEDSNILLQFNTVWSCQTPNRSRFP